MKKKKHMLASLKGFPWNPSWSKGASNSRCCASAFAALVTCHRAIKQRRRTRTPNKNKYTFDGGTFRVKCIAPPESKSNPTMFNHPPETADTRQNNETRTLQGYKNSSPSHTYPHTHIEQRQTHRKIPSATHHLNNLRLSTALFLSQHGTDRPGTNRAGGGDTGTCQDPTQTLTFARCAPNPAAANEASSLKR